MEFQGSFYLLVVSADLTLTAPCNLLRGDSVLSTCPIIGAGVRPCSPNWVPTVVISTTYKPNIKLGLQIATCLALTLLEREDRWLDTDHNVYVLLATNAIRADNFQKVATIVLFMKFDILILAFKTNAAVQMCKFVSHEYEGVGLQRDSENKILGRWRFGEWYPIRAIDNK